jgi:hypothetical protein
MMMEAALTSETSVDNYFTRQYIPEDKPELNTGPVCTLRFLLSYGVKKFNVHDNRLSPLFDSDAAVSG